MSTAEEKKKAAIKSFFGGNKARKAGQAAPKADFASSSLADSKDATDAYLPQLAAAAAWVEATEVVPHKVDISAVTKTQLVDMTEEELAEVAGEEEAVGADAEAEEARKKLHQALRGKKKPAFAAAAAAPAPAAAASASPAAGKYKPPGAAAGATVTRTATTGGKNLDVNNLISFPSLGGGPGSSLPASARVAHKEEDIGKAFGKATIWSSLAVNDSESEEEEAEAAGAEMKSVWKTAGSSSSAAAAGASPAAKPSFAALLGKAAPASPAPAAAAAAAASPAPAAAAPAPKAPERAEEEGMYLAPESATLLEGAANINKLAKSIAAELQESHDVKEAVTRISEMNVKPLSQRGLAVAALLRMGTEANAAVRGKVAEVLRELPSSKAVSAAVLSAAVAEFMEADAFADMKEDCPKLPSFLAEMLQGVTAVDAKLLHPEVAKAMGVSAAPAAAAAGAGEAAEEDDDELAAMLASGKKKSKKSSKKASE